MTPVKRSGASATAASGWAPLLIGAAAVGISLPARLAFRIYFSADAGSNLAATLLARAGQRPNLDFGFPFGPLTLALQQAAWALFSNGPYAMAALTLVGTLLFAAAASWAIRRLRLPWAPALMLWVATAMVGVSSLWEPVYTLESAALLWALVLFAGGARGAALSACVAAALLKPSMGLVLGAFFLAELLWRRAWRSLLLPLASGAGLAALLALIYGWRNFLRLALPLAGARNYRFAHDSFFSAAGNPFTVPGAHWGLYLGTPVGSWGVATLALLAAVALVHPQDAQDAAARQRWLGAGACALGTLAFITAFYSWKGSYWYYATLPLAGLALIAWPARRGLQMGLACLAGLVVLGTFTAVRANIQLWRRAGPSAATAHLWATAADAAAWQAFARAHPPSTHPLLLTGSGAPGAFLAGYGPPWHGFLYPGEATPRELQTLAARAVAAACVAYAPGVALPAATLAAMHRLRPVTLGALFDTYGCQ